MTQILAVSQSLMAKLQGQPFSGRLLSKHEKVLNFIDDGWLVSLVKPEVGMGPFSIMLSTDLWAKMGTGWLKLDAAGLEISGQSVAWADAAVWSARVHWPLRESMPVNLLASLRPYKAWPSLNEQHGLVGTELRRRALILQNARCAGEEVNDAMAALVGLGNGLTPAGDDYLLGFLAAIKLSHSKLTNKFGPHFEQTQTTALSLAFLQAASDGEFVESWHHLARELEIGEAGEFGRAVEAIASFGATSGQDALTGFAQTIGCVGNR